MKNSVWKTFMELSLVRGIVPRTVFGLTAIAAIILIIGLALSKSKKRGRLHPLIVSLIVSPVTGPVDGRSRPVPHPLQHPFSRSV